MTTVAPPAERRARPAETPDVRPTWEQAVLYVVVILPFLGVLVGIWLAAALGRGPSLLDAALAVAFFTVAGHGVTVGFHRLFTHGSFTARRGLRIGLALAGSLAIEGPVIRWVADHRRHHAFSDREGDPHSPWRFGSTPRAVVKGLWWAHTGWLFDRERTDKQRFAPDLLADKDLRAIHAAFPALALTSLLLPGVLGYLLSGGSWTAAWTALLWAGLVRVFVLHHVTWSINSICHVVGARPFVTRDKATNVWPLAILSMGESWHNLHHADPTCARHGVDPGQLDSSAAFIRGFERLGWATDVRWPRSDRLDRRRVAA
jgi:stearoyl-CoA desaturase (delta-9 desaturase)